MDGIGGGPGGCRDLEGAWIAIDNVLVAHPKDACVVDPPPGGLHASGVDMRQSEDFFARAAKHGAEPISSSRELRKLANEHRARGNDAEAKRIEGQLSSP